MRQAFVRAATLRPGTREDLRAMIGPGGLALRFWEESDYKTFTEFDRERWLETSIASLDEMQNILIVAELPNRILAGFVMVSLLRWFTTDPVASTYLLFVLPEYRVSPIGRMLVAAACEVAKGEGAKAIMVGSMAGIRSTEGTLMNCLIKQGFKRLGGFARKIL